MNQAVAVRLLERCGFRAELAADGREALAALTLRPYAAVLMDCQMPEMDGYQATTAIRRLEGDRHHTPIIAVTANAMRDDREKCLGAGMDDYLSKPLRADALSEALHRWIAESEDGDRDALDDAALADVPSDAHGELLGLYLTEAAVQLEALKQARDQSDAPATAAAAHALKGSSLTIGAVRVAASADALQIAARSGTLEHTARQLAGLESALREVTDTTHEAIDGWPLRTGRWAARAAAPEALPRLTDDAPQVRATVSAGGCYQPSVAGGPLNGPTRSSVIHPP